MKSITYNGIEKLSKKYIADKIESEGEKKKRGSGVVDSTIHITRHVYMKNTAKHAKR